VALKMMVQVKPTLLVLLFVHMMIGRDLREANLHIEATNAYNDGTGTHAMHGIASGEGDVVGTDKAQTLTQKTLTSPTITGTGAIAGVFYR
jgi:hypothetical protein